LKTALIQNLLEGQQECCLQLISQGSVYSFE
jgi:hypothetical protein